MAKKTAEEVAKSNPLRKALRDTVNKEVDNLAKELSGNDSDASAFESDGEVNLGDFTQVRRERTRIGQGATSQEEIILDELLMSVPKSQGYYLKLYKERGAGEYELKQRIDTWETWSDMELEITNLVRANTAKSPTRWGSGRYRVVIWREGGVRGTRLKPVDFVVDALEPEITGPQHVNAEEAVQNQLAGVAGIMRAIKEISPSTDMGQLQGTIAEAFKSGLSASSGNNNQMITLLAALLPVLIKPNQPVVTPQTDVTQLVATIMASIPKPIEQRPAEDPIGMLIKLKQAGILPDSKPSDEMNSDKIVGLVSALAPLISAQSGGNTENSALNELIRGVAPQLGKIIGDITGAIREVAKSKQRIVMPIQPDLPPTYDPGQMVLPLTVPNPPMPQNGGDRRVTLTPDQLAAMQINGNGNNGNGHNQTSSQPEPMDGVVMLPIFAKIQQAAIANDQNMFPEIEELLGAVISSEDTKRMLDGLISPDDILVRVRPYGGPFFETATARAYLGAFIEWMRTRIIAECVKCDTQFIFANNNEYQKASLCASCGETLALVS